MVLTRLSQYFWASRLACEWPLIVLLLSTSRMNFVSLSGLVSCSGTKLWRSAALLSTTLCPPACRDPVFSPCYPSAIKPLSSTGCFCWSTNCCCFVLMPVPLTSMYFYPALNLGSAPADAYLSFSLSAEACDKNSNFNRQCLRVVRLIQRSDVSVLLFLTFHQQVKQLLPQISSFCKRWFY